MPEANDAMGVFYLNQGDTQKAIRAFGDTKTNNAALAQILDKDYSEASSILSSIKNPNATTYYLSAIVAARTNNNVNVINNLRKAVKLDPSLLKRAQNDKELANISLSNL